MNKKGLKYQKNTTESQLIKFQLKNPLVNIASGFCYL